MKTWVLIPTWEVIQMTAKTVIFFLTFWTRRPQPGRRVFSMVATVQYFEKEIMLACLSA